MSLKSNSPTTLLYSRIILNFTPVFRLIFKYFYNSTLDASGFRLGVFDTTQKISFARQLSLEEQNSTNIAGYEALALEMAILNVNLNKKPTRIT